MSTLLPSEVTPKNRETFPFVEGVYVMTSLITPLTLLVTVIVSTIFFAHSWIDYEYGRLAPDAFGWSLIEKTEYAHATVNYLQSPLSVRVALEELSQIQLEDGSPLYNPRELEHMRDVKRLTDFLRFSLPILVMLFVVGASYIYVATNQLRKLIANAGWFTLSLVMAVAIFSLSSWEIFFELFHRTFFSAGSYTFEYSDSLIRMFPPQFWFDFAILVMASICLIAILMVAASHIVSRFSETMEQVTHEI